MNRSQTDYKVEIRRTFNASCDKLFEAWTDPLALKAWFCPNPETKCTLAAVDLKVGGKFRIVMQYTDGDIFAGSGQYTQIDPPNRLAFTWAWDESTVEKGVTQVAVDFVQNGEQSEMILVHTKLSSQESVQRHTHGWTGCADSLERYIAGQ